MVIVAATIGVIVLVGFVALASVGSALQSDTYSAPLSADDCVGGWNAGQIQWNPTAVGALGVAGRRRGRSAGSLAMSV
jgi:hypothetical protein